ncbi:hypothetical protein FQR65_LT02430 [Abscondita terminalis]|nr:hypothetical protein FQR65_LT02430 [Abscondita terminalis]
MAEDLSQDIKKYDKEIKTIEQEVYRLQQKLAKLKRKKSELEKEYNLIKSFDKTAEDQYKGKDFPWGSAIINSKTEEQKLRSVLDYCLDSSKCRRKLIATHFDEEWEQKECDRMCDNCKEPSTTVWYNITPVCKYIYSIIEKAEKQEVNLTLLKLLDVWYKGGDKNLRVENVDMPKVERQYADIIIAYLLMKGYLIDYKSYTAYATNCYIQKGRNCQFTEKTVIEMPISSKINLRGLLKRSSSGDEPDSKIIRID